MKNFDSKRTLSILAFLALALFSCYWTAESLYIWQPSITRVGTWMIAIVFYAVASLCFTRFLKAFDSHSYFDQGLFRSRAGHLVFGLLGLIIFWLVFSLPTNTHTLLYRSSIRDVVTNDLIRTDGYLKALKDNNSAINAINDEYEKMKNDANGILKKMSFEIKDRGNEGIDVNYNSHLSELEYILHAPIQRAAHPGKNQREWQRTNADYRKKTDDILSMKREEADKKINAIKQLMSSEKLERLMDKDDIALNNINNMSDVNDKTIRDICNHLYNDYAYIRDNAQYITFKNDEEKALYTHTPPTPESQAMFSVPAVWRDFLTTDKYNGHGFIWWVLLSLLVDLSAFIFFDMAYNEKNY